MTITITQGGRVFQLRGFLPAQKAQQLAPPSRDRSLQVAGKNTPVPLNYGRVSVPGIIGPTGTSSSGELVIAVIWGLGLHEEIETVYVNDDSSIGATRTDYLGSAFQPVDPTLADAIGGFADDLVLDTPDGKLGVCYSVFAFAPGDVGGAPRFQAVVKGRRVDWPENQGTEDALYSSTQIDIQVDGETVEDLSQNASTITEETGLTVDEPYITNSSTDNGLKVDYSPDIGTGDFCIEAKVLASGDSGLWDIFRYSSIFIWRLETLGVRVIIADGTDGNFVIDTTAYTLPDSGREYDIKLIRRSGTFTLEVDGVEQWTTTPGSNPDLPLNSSADCRTCYSESGTPHISSLRNLRLTVGDSRYTAEENAGGLPYSDSVRYTLNPAVHFSDLVRNPVYGLGSDVENLTESEAWCDESVDGSPRARTALSLTRPQRITDLLDLMATYAQCLYYNNGSNVFILPDQQVPESSRFVVDKWVDGSLVMTGLDDESAPTRVYVRYTEPESTTGVWGDAVTFADLAGVDTGEVPLRSTTLPLPGIYRVDEATLAAQARVARYVNRVEVTWVSPDTGIRYRPGDVVNVVDAEYGVDINVKVTAIEMISPGRHRIRGLRYDGAQYPTEVELPGTVGVVPVGAIVINTGTSVPSGWADYTTANGRHIVGAGGVYSVGDTGGSDTVSPLSGSTSSNDSHEGAGYQTFPSFRDYVGSVLDTRVRQDDPPDLTHSHSFTTGTITPDPLTHNVKLMEKTGSSSATFPAQAQIFGLGGLLAPDLQRVTAAAGRLIAAAASAGNSGSASVTTSLTTGVFDDTHDHWQVATAFIDDEFTLNNAYFQREDGGGIHDHFAPLSVERRSKRRKVAVYGGTSDFSVVSGMIVLWAGSLGALPTDYVLCDGTNGTPDLTDHFIEVAPEGDEGDAAGDDTIRVSGTTYNVSHEHRGTEFVTTHTLGEYAHENAISHNHSIDETASWKPPYYALAAIMYAP